MLIKKDTREEEDLLLMNHVLFWNRVTQENLFLVYLEPTPEGYRFLPMVNRGYLSREKGGIEACDYFNTFLFDLCKDLLETGYKDVHGDKFVQIRDNFIGFLQAINWLPVEEWERQVERLEKKEKKKDKRYFSEVMARLHNAVSNSSSEEERDEHMSIATSMAGTITTTTTLDEREKFFLARQTG
jgi:hypothetical protein